MPNAQDIILADIKAKIYNSIYIAAIIMGFFILGKISASNVVSDLALINWTYDSSAHTFSDGSTTYTIYDLINTCCTNVYHNPVALGQFAMGIIIDAAAAETYITSTQATELKGKLVPAA